MKYVLTGPYNLLASTLKEVLSATGVHCTKTVVFPAIRTLKHCYTTVCSLSARTSEHVLLLKLKYVLRAPIITPSIAWRREAWKEEALDDLP